MNLALGTNGGSIIKTPRKKKCHRSNCTVKPPPSLRHTLYTESSSQPGRDSPIFLLHSLCLSFVVYACMGAMDRILLHFFLFSSEPTTPLIREPTGSPDLLRRTQALSSKRTTEPSRRWTGYLVRTTTAWRMSPRLTLLAEERPAIPEEAAPRCSWTTTTILSPIREAIGLVYVGLYVVDIAGWFAGCLRESESRGIVKCCAN